MLRGRLSVPCAHAGLNPARAGVGYGFNLLAQSDGIKLDAVDAVNASIGHAVYLDPHFAVM